MSRVLCRGLGVLVDWETGDQNAKPSTLETVEEGEGVCGEGPETVVLVERCSLVVDGVDEEGTRTDAVGDVGRPDDRVVEHRRTQAVALVVAVDRKTSEQDGWDPRSVEHGCAGHRADLELPAGVGVAHAGGDTEGAGVGEQLVRGAVT